MADPSFNPGQGHPPLIVPAIELRPVKRGYLEDEQGIQYPVEISDYETGKVNIQPEDLPAGKYRMFFEFEDETILEAQNDIHIVPSEE